MEDLKSIFAYILSVILILFVIFFLLKFSYNNYFFNITDVNSDSDVILNVNSTNGSLSNIICYGNLSTQEQCYINHFSQNLIDNYNVSYCFNYDEFGSKICKLMFYEKYINLTFGNQISVDKSISYDNYLFENYFSIEEEFNCNEFINLENINNCNILVEGSKYYNELGIENFCHKLNEPFYSFCIEKFKMEVFE